MSQLLIRLSVVALLSQFEVIFALSLVLFGFPLVPFIFISEKITYLLAVPLFALLGSNTALVYALAAVPYWISTTSGGKHLSTRAGISISALAIAAIAVVPGAMSHAAFREFAETNRSGDFSLAATNLPRSFAFPEEPPSEKRRLRSGAIASPTCNFLCQSLLYNIGADAVFVGTWKFSIERHDRCPPIRYSVHSNFFDRYARGDCLIEQESATFDPDVVFVRPSKPNAVPEGHGRCDSRAALWSTNEPRTLEVLELRNSGHELVERRTEVSGRVVPLPFFIGFSDCRKMDVRLKLASWNRISGEASYTEVLRRRYGIEIGHAALSPVAKLPDPSGGMHSFNRSDLRMIDDVRRILSGAYGLSEKLSKTETDIVRRVIAAIQGNAAIENRVLKSEEMEILRLAIQQRALVDFAGFNHGSPRHASTYIALLPYMIERLETVPNGQENIRWDLIGVMRALPVDALRPYAQRIGSILDDPDRSKYVSAILDRWEEISDTPVPGLLFVLTTNNRPGFKATMSAFRSLCRMNAATDPAVADVLFATLTQRNFEYPDSAVVALIRAGHRDRLIASAAQAKDSRMEYILRSTRDDADAKACL